MTIEPATDLLGLPSDYEPSTRDVEDVERAYATSASNGLDESEAKRRLDAYGPNEIKGKPPVPAWKRFLAQFRDPLVYLLFAAIGISAFAWALEGAHGVPVDATVILAIILLNAIVGFVQENRASDAVAALEEMTAATATVLRGGQLRTIDARELVPGDLLVLGEGDSVGADARLTSASSLRIQEASLTGESEAVTKDPARLEEKAGIGDRRDMVFKGTSVVQGVGRAIVTATAMGTEMGAIATMLDETEQDDSPLTKEIAKVSKMLGVAVIAIAAVVMAVLFLLNDVSTADDAIEILLLGVSLAVAAVPEGLPAILTVVLAIGVQRLAKRNAVVKELDSVETLGSASVIGSDKTGTLTRNEMTVQRIVTANGELRVTGIGYAPEGRLHAPDGGETSPALSHEANLLLAIGSRANNAQLGRDADRWRIEGDPTEAAILVAAGKASGVAALAEGFDRVGEIPFTSERKMMSTVELAPDGRRMLASKGAPDVLLERCTRIQDGRDVRPLAAEDSERILGSVEGLSDLALRTLGVAYRPLDDPGSQAAVSEEDERDLVWVGVVGIIDPPREEARRAIGEAHRGGIETIMITGDHPATAWRIACDLGIPDAPAGTPPGEAAPNSRDGVLTGVQLEGMSDADLREAVEDVSVYARVSPDHKRRIVDALQERGRVVAMTGDGVNDAPALKTADIGVAMGITGTEVTKQSARMILVDDNYATIVAAVRGGRVIFDNIRKFLRFLLSSNMGEVFTVFFGVVLAGVIGLSDAGGAGVVVPLLATQILWINLVTDTGPALAMGVDPEIDDVMARRPRNLSTPIVDGIMWRTILFTGFVMGSVALLSLDVFLPGGLIEGDDSLEVARTVAFTTLVFAQLFNALNARSETTSAFSHMFTNRWLWGAIALTTVLQVAVVHVPALRAAFSTAPLDLAHWAVAIGMASLVLWCEEIRKVVLRSVARDR